MSLSGNYHCFFISYKSSASVILSTESTIIMRLSQSDGHCHKLLSQVELVSGLDPSTHGLKVFMTHFRYVGMRRAYTNGLATELKAANHTAGIKSKVCDQINNFVSGNN